MADQNLPKQAIALSYDGTEAPIVSASGQGLIAEQIEQLAQQHQVLIHQDPQLAALLSKLQLGEQIPPSLYQVIAELLAFAYRLDGKR